MRSRPRVHTLLTPCLPFYSTVPSHLRVTHAHTVATTYMDFVLEAISFSRGYPTATNAPHNDSLCSTQPCAITHTVRADLDQRCSPEKENIYMYVCNVYLHYRESTIGRGMEHASTYVGPRKGESMVRTAVSD